jgi:hypothetical protein
MGNPSQTDETRKPRLKMSILWLSQGKPQKLPAAVALSILKTALPYYFRETSAVVGSITVRTSEMRLAGKPPLFACLRTISSLGAM